jgi:hypothetical protein
MSMQDQQNAILGELAQLGLSSARDLHARQLAAETPEQASRLAFALHRISRSLRQTLALQARLERDAQRAEREDAAEVVELDKRRFEKRKAQVKAAVESLIWTEAESPEAYETFSLELEDLLAIETQDAEAFEDEPVDDQIARLCSRIGLQIPPPDDPPPPAVILRSGDRPDPGDPNGLADPEPQLGSPAPTCGRAEDDAERGIADDDPLLSDDYWSSSA